MIIGIDNGLDGGIAAIDEDGKILWKRPMPTVKLGKGRQLWVESVWNIIQQETPRLIIIEEASKHSAGTLALCSTWFSFGMLTSVAKLSGCKYEIVRPQAWQKAFWARPKMPKGTKFDTKAAALNAANRIWPGTDWTKSERATKAHDGMVDAALLAEYGRRMRY